MQELIRTLVLLFLLLDGRMLFGNGGMFVEHAFIGDRFVVALFFCCIFDDLILVRDMFVCFGNQAHAFFIVC